MKANEEALQLFRERVFAVASNARYTAHRVAKVSTNLWFKSRRSVVDWPLKSQGLFIDGAGSQPVTLETHSAMVVGMMRDEVPSFRVFAIVFNNTGKACSGRPNK